MKIDVRELQQRLQKRLQNRSALAVQLKSSSLSVSLMKFEGATGASVIVHTFTLPFGTDAIASNPDKVGKELGEQLQKEGVKEKRCVVCIPPGWALSTSTDLPEISDEDLRGYLELQAEREFPMAVADMRLAHSNYVLPDGKRRATIVAVQAKRVAAIEQMLTTAGCRLVSLSLGLDRFVSALPTPGAMHFLANGTHVDLVIATGGGIAALRSLSGSVGQEDEPFDVAAFCREVRITLGGLPDAARQQVREVHFGGPRATAELLCTKTSDQLRRMGVDAAEVERGVDGPVAAIEAAEQYLRSQPVAFEFLPPQVNRWVELFKRHDSKRHRMFALAGLVLVVLPIAAFFIRSKIESNLEAEWTGMKGRVADLETIQQNIRQFRPWFDPAPETLFILQGLISAFPDGGDVWAKSIHISEGSKVTCSGFARNRAAFSTLHDRLRARADVSGIQVQTIRGENPIQFTFSFKWDSSHAK